MPSSFCLTTKCIVTGASSGIGKATCQILTRNGASVIGTARNAKALENLKSEGSIMDYVVADITKDGKCKYVVDVAVEKLGGSLTTLVNNAGVLSGGAMGSPSVGMENYDFNMNTNTRAPFEMMIHAIPFLKATAKDGLGASVVNVSSVNGKQAFPGCVSYCMSKAAIDQLTRCASVDLAADGIRVNSVNPGVIETNIHKTSGLSNDDYEKFLQRSRDETHPISKSLGRVGQPEEVGDLISFLVSDKTKFLTGETIAIDGGRQNLGAR